ncbi:hypothetical protein ACSSS7_001807 [Eimeria intestinalis]
MGPGEVDVVVVVSDSDQDALRDTHPLLEQCEQTPHRALAHHQRQQEGEASVRRARRSVNLGESDDSQEGPGRPSPGLPLTAASGATPRRSARLAAARCSLAPAVATPTSARKSLASAKNIGLPQGEEPPGSKASSPKPSSPISVCTPSLTRLTGRLRRPELSLSREHSASPQFPAEEETSRPRRRRRARPVVIADDDSSEEHSLPPHDPEGLNSGNSSSSSGSSSRSAEAQQDGLGDSKADASASAPKKNTAWGASAQQDSHSSSSSSSDTSSDSGSDRTRKRRRRGNKRASSSKRISQDKNGTQLEACHGRLRKRPLEPVGEQQQQQQQQGDCESSEKDATAEDVSLSSRPSPKEVQQRLRQLAKKVKEKQLRSRGLHAPAESLAAGGSSIDADDSSSSSSSTNERPRTRVRAPLSARKASKFFSFSRDLQEAASDSDSSGSSFIVDSPRVEEEACRASEEALTSDSSDSSEDEAISALRFHNRMKEQQETSQAVEQTMRLRECFDKYLFSLALSLFSPELSLKKLQERQLTVAPSSSSPIAKVLACCCSSSVFAARRALSKVEVRLLVGAVGRIERLTLAKRNSMETHAFPPECKEHLKRYPECRLSEGPELQDAVLLQQLLLLQQVLRAAGTQHLEECENERSPSGLSQHLETAHHVAAADRRGMGRELMDQGFLLSCIPGAIVVLCLWVSAEQQDASCATARPTGTTVSISWETPTTQSKLLQTREKELHGAADAACAGADALWEGDVSSWLASKGLEWIGRDGPPLPSRKTPAGLVECYEARTGQELPVGAKCGKQAASWHAVHHYKARLLMSIHSILRLRHPDELRDPCAAAERVRELHGSGFFADWEEEVMSLPIPK